MDQLLFDCADRCCVLSSILQLCIYELAAIVAAENRTTVVQLRGHFNEFPGFACYAKSPDQSDTAQGLQRPRKWQVSLCYVIMCVDGWKMPWYTSYDKQCGLAMQSNIAERRTCANDVQCDIYPPIFFSVRVKSFLEVHGTILITSYNAKAVWIHLRPSSGMYILICSFSLSFYLFRYAIPMWMPLCYTSNTTTEIPAHQRQNEICTKSILIFAEMYSYHPILPIESSNSNV